MYLENIVYVFYYTFGLLFFFLKLVSEDRDVYLDGEIFLDGYKKNKS